MNSREAIQRCEGYIDPPPDWRDPRRMAFNYDTIAFSPDGTRVVCSLYNGTARVWDVATGLLLLQATSKCDGALCVAFSPDSCSFAAATDEGPPHLWDARTGQLLGVCECEAGVVTQLAFSADGQRVVALSDREGIQVWDAKSRKWLTQLHLEEAEARRFALAPDGWGVAVFYRTDDRYRGRFLPYWEKRVVVWTPRELELPWERRVEDWHARLAADFEERNEPPGWISSKRNKEEAPGAWFAAEFHLTRLPEHQPQDMKLLNRRGNVAASHGHWTKATADFARCCELQPGKAFNWYRRGLSCFAGGDEPEYRRLCDQALQRFGGTEDPDVAFGLLFLVGLRPVPEGQQKDVLRLSRLILSKANEGDHVIAALGRHRAGQSKEAVKTLQRLIAKSNFTTGTFDVEVVLALAHQAGQETEKAHACFERAMEDHAKNRMVSWDVRLLWAVLAKEFDQLSKNPSPEGGNRLNQP